MLLCAHFSQTFLVVDKAQNRTTVIYHMGLDASALYWALLKLTQGISKYHTKLDWMDSCFGTVAKMQKMRQVPHPKNLSLYASFTARR